MGVEKDPFGTPGWLGQIGPKEAMQHGRHASRATLRHTSLHQMYTRPFAEARHAWHWSVAAARPVILREHGPKLCK